MLFGKHRDVTTEDFVLILWDFGVYLFIHSFIIIIIIFFIFSQRSKTEYVFWEECKYWTTIGETNYWYNVQSNWLHFYTILNTDDTQFRVWFLSIIYFSYYCLFWPMPDERRYVTDATDHHVMTACYSAVVSRPMFFEIITQLTPHSSPARASYRVSVVISKSMPSLGLYAASCGLQFQWRLLQKKANKTTTLRPLKNQSSSDRDVLQCIYTSRGCRRCSGIFFLHPAKQ